MEDTCYYHADHSTYGDLNPIAMIIPLNTRHHRWNENGQLAMFLSDDQAGYYGYDGNGERVYKLTGYIYDYDYNAGQDSTRVYFNDAVLYVNPYFIVTPKGYTKHYYNGSQRLVSVVGDIEELPDEIIGNTSTTKSKEYLQTFANNDTLVNVNVDYEKDLLYPVLGKVVSNHSDHDLNDNTYYYHGDHLGSMSWITDGFGNIIEHRTYLPYGETWYERRTDRWWCKYTERFRFTGKERDDESGYDYFGARYFDAMLLTGWLSVDPLAGKYPYMNPYAYCENNPMSKYDPNGMWSVKVSASANRKDHPYALYQVYSRSGKMVYQTVVKAQGLHRNRCGDKGDTPTGTSKILGWRKTGVGTRYKTESYGPNDLLALEYVDGEAKGSGRSGMHTHGGRNQEELTNTWGCIRMADEDIAEMKGITDMLEAADPKEFGTLLNLQDNLSQPVDFKTDRAGLKDFIRDGGDLPEITVTGNKPSGSNGIGPAKRVEASDVTSNL